MYITISLLFALYGLIIEEPEPICLAGVVFFFLYPAVDYYKNGISSVTPASLFSLIKGLVSLSNLIGLLFIEDEDIRKIYLKYISEDHIFTASLIHYFGSLLIITGFEAAIKYKSGSFPLLSYELSAPQLNITFPFIAIVVVLVVFFNLVPSLGVVSNLIQFFPVASVFFFARYGSSCKNNKYIRIGFAIMIVATLHAILHSYLRMLLILPGTAFILGLIFGQKSLSALKSPITIPIYLGGILFISYFSFLGETRSNMGYGWERLENAEVLASEIEEEQESTFLSRFSNISQLSQIGRVVDEDGFYNGETISYLAYGFIPRFIWPDKPIIQQGAWFAYRIGQGRLVNGRYTNSIDMSPPGELYLNFGWIGLCIGSIILGAFLGKLWLSSDFWKSEINILGSLFGFYLFYLGLISFGSDLQIIITAIAMYLIFFLINKGIGYNKIEGITKG